MQKDGINRYLGIDWQNPSYTSNSYKASRASRSHDQEKWPFDRNGCPREATNPLFERSERQADNHRGFGRHACVH